MNMELKTECLDIPEGCNVVFGQTHFIKTVEDLYEIMVGSVPNAKFGIAFSEASGHCLVRGEGNDENLKQVAMKNAMKIGAGHTFIVLIKDAFPINFLNAVKLCQEVCSIFCATANPVEVILAQSDQGRGVLGVIDGSSPKGIEKEDGVAWRKDLLRKFRYKL
jgi:adenosine/AMP kinase